MPKKTFKDAKQAAFQVLNSCPIDVICHFVNGSWHFMSAYQVGLTGKATMWAVQK